MIQTYLTPRVRYYLYLVLAILGLTLTSTTIGYATVEAGQPDWLKIAQAVFTTIATAVGYTAASHTPVAETNGKPDAEVGTLTAEQVIETGDEPITGH